MARSAEGLSAEKHRPRLLRQWRCNGTLTRIHHALYAEVRKLAGKEPMATTAMVDSQSVKSAEKGGLGSMFRLRCGQENQGKKRHLSVDTLGLMVGFVVTPGDIQDRDVAAHAVEGGAQDVSLARARHRRWWLSRQSDRQYGSRRGEDTAGDRQAI